jgi:hypothetical protein
MTTSSLNNDETHALADSNEQDMNRKQPVFEGK